MSSEDLSWVGSLGQKMGVAEDALRLIIGMILGKYYGNLAGIVLSYIALPLLRLIKLRFIYFSVSSFLTSQ